MTEPLSVALSDVTLVYETDRGTITALDGVTLAVEARSSLAIVGRSGCGKSTLLGLVAGLATATSGRVSIGGRDISALPEEERMDFHRGRIGMVYQADNLLPFLTVAENVLVRLALATRGVNERRVHQLLEALGLDGLSDRLPDELSGGERQRVAVARAVVHRPGLLLCDEPTGALDNDNAARVIELLVDLHQDLGSTLIVVTHNPAIAERLERTIRLDAGRVVQVLRGAGAA
jgi:putative ABC transport system ATP-binding protein